MTLMQAMLPEVLSIHFVEASRDKDKSCKPSGLGGFTINPYEKKSDYRSRPRRSGDRL